MIMPLSVSSFILYKERNYFSISQLPLPYFFSKIAVDTYPSRELDPSQGCSGSLCPLVKGSAQRIKAIKHTAPP